VLSKCEYSNYDSSEKGGFFDKIGLFFVKFIGWQGMGLIFIKIYSKM